jgi:hypothetical protein
MARHALSRHTVKPIWHNANLLPSGYNFKHYVYSIVTAKINACRDTDWNESTHVGLLRLSTCTCKCPAECWVRYGADQLYYHSYIAQQVTAELIPYWAANRLSASAEIPRILWTPYTYTVFTRALHLGHESRPKISPPISLASILILSPNLSHCLLSGVFLQISPLKPRILMFFPCVPSHLP